MITAEDFSALLQGKQLPETMNEADMQALVQKYPWFAPARLMLLRKQTLDQHPDAAATRSVTERYVPAREVVQQWTQPDFWLTAKGKLEEELFQPAFSEDYFLHQGIKVSDDLESALEDSRAILFQSDDPVEKDKLLTPMRSFNDWLLYYKSKNDEAREEEEEKRNLKFMWQREKLSAAMDEEADEIPDQVFQMAVDSIANTDDLVSEPLAKVLAIQGKKDKAIEMYEKLKLLNPGKSDYFAQQIKNLQSK
jgi:hypothetical protein